MRSYLKLAAIVFLVSVGIAAVVWAVWHRGPLLANDLVDEGLATKDASSDPRSLPLSGYAELLTDLSLPIKPFPIHTVVSRGRVLVGTAGLELYVLDPD